MQMRWTRNSALDRLHEYKYQDTTDVIRNAPNIQTQTAFQLTGPSFGTCPTAAQPNLRALVQCLEPDGPILDISPYPAAAASITARGHVHKPG